MFASKIISQEMHNVYYMIFVNFWNPHVDKLMLFGTHAKILM
jgi:hypothetical protein